jgi:hypothetical protein
MLSEESRQARWMLAGEGYGMKKVVTYFKVLVLRTKKNQSEQLPPG